MKASVLSLLLLSLFTLFACQKDDNYSFTPNKKDVYIKDYDCARCSCTTDSLIFNYSTESRSNGFLQYTQCFELSAPVKMYFDFQIEGDSIELMMLPNSFGYDNWFNEHYSRKWYFNRVHVRKNKPELDFPLGNLVAQSQDFYRRIE